MFSSLAKGVVGAVLDKVAPEVGAYFRERQQQEHLIELERLKGKQAWEMAKTQRAIISEGRDFEWEMASLKAHSKTWKDEWVLIVISIPAILAFTPWSKIVEEGFKALSTTPIWYQGILGAVFLAVYGIRYVRNTGQEKDIMTRLHELEKERLKHGYYYRNADASALPAGNPQGQPEKP